MIPSLRNFADACIQGTSECIQNVPKTDPSTAIPGVLGVVYWLAGVVAVIVIIVAGLFYITAAGSPQQVAQARTMIIAAVIGLVVVVSAFTITHIVLGGF